jgi:hypothetical protein
MSPISKKGTNIGYISINQTTNVVKKPIGSKCYTILIEVLRIKEALMQYGDEEEEKKAMDIYYIVHTLLMLLRANKCPSNNGSSIAKYEVDPAVESTILEPSALEDDSRFSWHRLPARTQRKSGMAMETYPGASYPPGWRETSDFSTWVGMALKPAAMEERRLNCLIR